MNVFSLIPSFAFLINSFVAVYIFAQKRKSKLINAFVFYSFDLAIWILSEAVIRQHISSETTEVIIKLSSIAWLSAGVWFLNFLYRFLDRPKDKFFYTLVGIAFVAIIISLSTNMIIYDNIKFYWGIDIIIGPLYFPAVTLCMIVPTVYGMYLMIKCYAETKNRILQESLPLIITGTIISFLLAFISNIFIPYILNYRNSFQFAESASAIQSLFIFVAVYKYRLFGLGIEDLSNVLFNTTQDAVVILDHGDRIVQMNKSAEKIFEVDFLSTQYNKIDTILNMYYEIPAEGFQDIEIKINDRKKYLTITINSISQYDTTIGSIIFLHDISIRKRFELDLKESELRYRTVVETIPYGLVKHDCDGNIYFLNSVFAEMHGYKKEELLGTKIWNLNINERSREEMKESIKRFIELQPIPSTEYIQRITKSGEIIDIQIDWNYRRDAQRNITGFVSVFTNITERKKAERLIEKNRMMLNQAEELAYLGSWEWDIKNDVLSWSDELYRIFGVDKTSFHPSFKAFIEKVHPENRKFVKNSLHNMIKTGEPVSYNEKIIRPDGEVRVLSTRSVAQKNSKGEVYSLIGSCLDVTEYITIETNLLKSQEQLRALSANLQSTREEERRHIAREIHDELGQVLTAINMDVGLIIDDIENDELISKENLIKDLQGIENLVDGSIKTVRNIAAELRPDVLDHLGLISAIEWYLEEFKKRFKIDYSYTNTVKDIEFNDHERVAIFRIVQETLTNVARHAEAAKVDVNIRIENNNLIIFVKDNGKGIKLEEIENIKSIGIIGMQERVSLIGGHISITGKENEGTTIHLTIPIRVDEEVWNENNFSR